MTAMALAVSMALPPPIPMMISHLFFTAIFFLLSSVSMPYALADDEKLDNRIYESIDLLEEMIEMPDNSIPEDILTNCSGIAIFPSVIKGGFFLGGRYGKGVILRHIKKDGTWCAPAFYTIKGLSYGLQIGGQSIDLIFVITTDRGMDSFLTNEVSLGGDIAVAAGPLGRNASVDTDLKFKSNIYKIE